MGCCKDDTVDENPGVVVKRKCRDVICVILFFVWWIGMLLVAGFSYREGDADRLVYGIDSYGLTCGHLQTLDGRTMDFTELKNTYYLNPLELLEISNIPYAKKVCVAECPEVPTCTTFPCTVDEMFVCPYYALADNDLYGKIAGVDDIDTSYYDQLATIPDDTATADQTAFIAELSGLGITWVDDFLAATVSGATVTGGYYQLTSQFPGKGPCYPVYIKTADFFNRCVPRFPAEFTEGVTKFVNAVGDTVPEEAKDAFKTLWQSMGERFARYTSDLSKGFLILIVAGLIVGLVVSVVYLLIMRYLAPLLVWGTLILVNLALTGVTLYSFAMAGMLGNSSWVEDLVDKLQEFGNPQAVDQEVWKYIGITAAVIAGLVLLLTLLMISRLRVAVACLKVASQAIGASPFLLAWPLIPFMLLLGLILYWVAITAMLYTAGDLTATCRDPADWTAFNFDEFASIDPAQLLVDVASLDDASTTECYKDLTGDSLRLACASDPNCYVGYKWNDDIRYAFLYHFYGLLWTSQVIVGISCVVVAATVGQFYWAGGDVNKMSSWPVSTGAKYGFIFSLGSVCFGASIVAILMWIRYVLTFIDNRLKALSGASWCATWFTCCISCCLWVLQKIIEFINRNAYIMCAVKGTNYCVSAARAVKLLVMNALRLITVNIVGDTLIFLGKVAIAATCGVCAFFMAELDYYNNPVDHPKTYLSSPLWPVLISILIGFFIAEVFLSVYELAIDTIFLCFCDDCDTHGGEPALAPPILLDVMGVDEPSTAAAPIVKGNKVLPEAG
mmetsp:Transcript_8104/g.16758  ORF Transcript_8104/g.16758 Transcript_8104/m.16758 type:complete len:786 (-) Transcript_8104:485-2842(-)